MTESKAKLFFVGVDVGTGSARGGVSDSEGKLLGLASTPIKLFNPSVDHYEHSSADIWASVCASVKAAVAKSGVAASDIAGIGFDATCSLVVLDKEDKPVSVSTTDEDDHNVIVWMDHRALAETQQCNETKHEVLRYVGGVMSPEMEVPKLLWLKKHKAKSWARARRFLDLADFLSYSATGSDVRSVCTLTCKWTFQSHKAESGQGWSDSFFEKVGLSEFVRDGYERIGQRVCNIGDPIGKGLTEAAAKQLGLAAGTAVAVGIIDAHCGGVGMLGARLPASVDCKLHERLALICGTSSCHMAVSDRDLFVPGVWGPYLSAMLPGLWLLEGGQSATGALLDHVINTHPAHAELEKKAAEAKQSPIEFLNARVSALAVERLGTTAKDGAAAGAASDKTAAAAAAAAAAACVRGSALLTERVHVLPDFHGNRSPWADPTLTGTVAGLTLDASLDDLAVRYLATIQALAYGTRNILRAMEEKGARVRVIFACGGLSKNPLFVREHADATGRPIVLPREPDAVLLGAAVTAARASGAFSTLDQAMTVMNHAGTVVEPAAAAAESKDGSESAAFDVRGFHDRKFAVYLRMHEDQLAYRALMKAPAAAGAEKKQ